MPKRNKEMEEFSRKVKEDFKDSSVMSSIEDPNKRACALISCRPAHDKLREISKNYPINYRRCARILKVIESILNEMDMYRSANQKISLAIYMVHPYPLRFIAEEIIEGSQCTTLKRLIFSYFKTKYLSKWKELKFPSISLAEKELAQQHPFFQYRNKWLEHWKSRTLKGSTGRWERFVKWRLDCVGPRLRNCPNMKGYCRYRHDYQDPDKAQEMFFKCLNNTSGFKSCLERKAWHERKMELDQSYKEYMELMRKNQSK